MVDKILAFWDAHLMQISDAMLMVAVGLLVFCLVWMVAHAIEWEWDI